MAKKRLIKKFLMILFLVILMIAMKSTTSNAASTLPLTAKDLYQWRNTTKFFDIDPVECINKYRTGKSTLDSSGGESGRYICCGNISGGQGNLWHIQTIIDVDGEGNVTVYYYNESKKTAVAQTVSDKTDQKWFNALAYGDTHIGQQAEGYSGSWSTFSSDHVTSMWHTMASDGILSKYHIPTFSWESMYVNNWGQERETRQFAANLHYEKDKKVRIMQIEIADGQRRLISGTVKEDDNTIIITKKDAIEENKLLGGAIYKIYNEKGKVIGENLQTAKKGTNKGKIIVTNKQLKEKLVVGKKYTIEEVTPPEGYLLQKKETNRKKTITIKKGQNTVNFKNNPKYGTIKVLKKDSKTGKKLKGAVFTCYNTVTGKSVQKTTDSKGYATFSKVEVGTTYKITEIKAPKGYKITFKPRNVTVKEGEKLATITAKDDQIPPPPDHSIIKLIKGTDIPLEGVKFAIKNWEPDNSEYKVDGKRQPLQTDSKYYVWHNDGHWTWKTVDTGKKDENGNAITQLERDQWVDTSYREFLSALYNADYAEWKDWYENNQYYHKSLNQYVAEGTSDKDGYVSLSGDIRSGTYTLYEIESENPYFNVRVDGKDTDKKEIKSQYRKGDKLTIENDRTFVDIEGVVFIDNIEGKQSNRDNLYSEGEGVNGVKVSLKRKGIKEPICEITSGKDSKGETLEEGQYKFWGDRDNLKIETQYLSEYTIEFEYNGMKYESIPTLVKEENGSKAFDVSASRNSLNQKYSTITNNSDVDYNRIDYKSETVYTPDEVYAQDKYHVIASTGSVYNLLDGYNPENDEIVDVNLGIVERDQPDLALVEDIDRVNMRVNGIEHTFIYNYRFDKENEYGNRYDEPAIKYGSLYGSLSYTRAIYPSDIHYTLAQDTPNDKKLDIRAIYKIEISNQSTTRVSKVNRINYYYDNKYEIVKVGDLKGNRVVENVNKCEIGNQGDGYVEINTNITVNPQKDTEDIIYIEVKVKEEVYNELLTSDIPITFQSVAEIASYTTLEEGTNKEIAGIDVDSAPGNVDINNIKTFEDDTDRAPGFCLVLQANRSVSGTVFEDSTTEAKKLNSGEERKGNGIFDENEKVIEGVTVRLVDANTGNIVKTYETASEIKDASMTTDAQGNYQFRGVLPGDYKIEFIWGNNTYLVQDYKSTIVEQKSYEAKLNGDGLWYNEKFKRNGNFAGIEWNEKSNSEIRRSDAVDDQIIRKQVDEASSDMTNKTITDLKRGTATMTSRTPLFKINYEYSEIANKESSYGNEEYKQISGNRAEKNQGYANEIKSIDLGIVRRAKQELKLTKRIKKVTLALDNGVILMDAEVVKDENGGYRLKDKVKNVAYIPISPAANGMIKMETDDEIVQSAKLSVTYEFIIENKGEVEYLTEDYYNYGKVPSSEAEREDKVIKVKPNAIIDYMDNAKIILQSKDWDLLEKPYKLVEDGYITSEIEESVNKIPKVMQINNIMKDKNAYLSPEGMKNTSITTIEMLVSKLMAPNEEFEVGNQAEIIKSNKTGGSILLSTHGNYNPVNQGPKESDSSMAEDIIIIPATGENRNYSILIVMVISSILIIGAGIIIIKKIIL